MALELTTIKLRQIALMSANTHILDGIVAGEQSLIDAGIIGIRKQYFLAQAAEETDGFRTTVEYASGFSYEGREDLGNTEDGDGMRYKGRGIFQITGRANYRRYGTLIGADLENNPETASLFPTAMQTAIAYWNANNLSTLADQEDFEGVTRRINGGLNGLEFRQAYLDRIVRAGIGV